ncbi:MAG: universal stress protein [Planctomycetes bacterium]|nr:universal stress protein [Planctomycetota bacterium]
MELRNLLVTTDFSEHARKAYPAATALAKEFQARIHLVHVADALPPFYYMNYEGLGTEIPQTDYFDELDRQLREEVRHAAFEQLEINPHLLHDGQPHEVLKTLCEKEAIDLLVISTHGHTSFGHALLGSFAQKIVRHSDVPVLIYREKEGAAQPYVPREIIVPFDFSENSRAVIPAVKEISSEYRSRFTFLYVLESVPAVVSMTPGGVFYDSFWQAARDAAGQAQEHFDKLKAEQFPDVDARLETADGIPYLKIIDRARELSADLVLMTTHGWTGLKHFFLGSVSEKIVRKAPCSVLTLRPADAEEKP